MNPNDALAIFKRHLSGISEIESPKLPSHNFGNNMKGVNEFIGAVQTLSINLTKIKNLSEKIAWIDELLGQGSAENAPSAANAANSGAESGSAGQNAENGSAEKSVENALLLKSERDSHTANIKYVLAHSKFMGVELFGSDLSCAFGGAEFAINVQNPLETEHPLDYCLAKIDELGELLGRLSAKLNSDEDVASCDVQDSNEAHLDYGDAFLGAFKGRI